MNQSLLKDPVLKHFDDELTRLTPLIGTSKALIVLDLARSLHTLIALEQLAGAAGMGHPVCKIIYKSLPDVQEIIHRAAAMALCDETAMSKDPAGEAARVSALLEDVLDRMTTMLGTTIRNIQFEDSLRRVK